MITPGQTVPSLELPLTNGTQFKLADQSPENFTMLVFYRGKHCPICKKYLEELGGKLSDFVGKGINTVAISMDSEERAMVAHNDWKTGDLPIARGLSEETARKWGLFISEKRPDSEEPDVFSEPGLFLVRPDGELYFQVVQNAPFTRPSLDELLQAMDFVLEKDYPTRGTLA